MGAKKKLRANRRNFVHYQSNFVRDAMERWDRWPFVEEGDGGLAQSYLKGRLEIAVEFGISGDSNHSAIALIRASKAIRKGSAADRCVEPNPRRVKECADQAMLFEIAEPVEVNKERVPSIIRLDFVDNNVKKGFGDLAFMLSEGVYRTVSRVPYWEIDLSSSIVFHSESGSVSVVKSAPSVNDTIAKNEQKRIVERLLLEAYDCVSCLNITMEKNQIFFTRNVVGKVLKVSNVMLCASKF